MNQTVLPLSRLKAAANLLPFIDVPNRTDPQWLQLVQFGVIVQETLTLYLRQLKAIAKQPLGGLGNVIKIPELQVLYREIADRSVGNEDVIR